MDSRDRAYLAQALAKAAVQPGVKHHGSLELAADQASFECDCLAALDDTGYVRTSRGLLPCACTHARPEAFHGRLYPYGDGADGHRNQS
jgi:hypothetical protein